MIHEAFKITEIALRYYKITHPERKYSRHYAVKQWRQDKKIDKKIVLSIVNQINSEQKTILK